MEGDNVGVERGISISKALWLDASFYRTDILMLGLFLEKLIWQSYRVGFEVKQLWLPPTDNDYNCIYTPILNHRTKSDRCTYRIKYGIDRDNHDFYFRRALESTRIRYGDVFNGTVSSGFLIELNDRMNTPRLKHDFYAESQYYEFQIAMAVYFQEYDRLEKIYAELDKECSYWSRKLKRGRRIYGLTQSSDISSWRKISKAPYLIEINCWLYARRIRK